MTGKKFYIVPNRRTVTSEMKESGSYFLCPTNTGRYHSGDENGQTQYEYTTLKTMIINLVFILLSTISIYGQTASTVVCTLGASLDDMRDNKKKERGWKAAIGLSVCLLASSVPLLALAYENKRKAKSLSFTASSLSVDLSNGSRQAQPALGLCLNF